MDIPRRMEVIQSYKNLGGQIAAVLPIHYPRALLRAFNILPVELWGPPGIDSSRGRSHLQSYICSIARNALAFFETGGLDVVDCMLIPHACDSLQGLASIFLDFITCKMPVIPIYLPRGRRKSDLEFLSAEFHSVYHRLEQFTGQSPLESQLMECNQREENADILLQQLHKKRRDLPLQDIDFYRLIRAREYLPAERFIEIANSVLTHATNQRPIGTPIILSGIVPEPMNVLEKIAQMGASVVGDDLACCSRRLYPPGTSLEPFMRMAERILSGPPDTMMGSPIADRIEHLLHLAKETQARGVVFYQIKFCEPELFDLPIVRDGLHSAGIPSVAVEVDLSEPISQAILNRIEAFLEMIA